MKRKAVRTEWVLTARRVNGASGARAAQRWSGREIADAITGLVELDAISKGDGERAWGPALTRWSATRIG